MSFLLLASTLATADPDEGREFLPFEEIERGEFSFFRYDDPDFTGAEFHFTDRRSWEAFWERHTRNRRPAPPPPEIKFPHENVIVVLLGFQPTGGRLWLGVQSVVRTGHRNVTIEVLEDRTQGFLTAITNPYQIIKTPNLGKSIAFLHVEPEGGICQIPQHCGTDTLCTRVDPTCASPVTGRCTFHPPGSACPLVYIPVCGCDGMTYGNGCELELAEAVFAHLGECD